METHEQMPPSGSMKKFSVHFSLKCTYLVPLTKCIARAAALSSEQTPGGKAEKIIKFLTSAAVQQIPPNILEGKRKRQKTGTGKTSGGFEEFEMRFLDEGFPQAGPCHGSRGGGKKRADQFHTLHATIEAQLLPRSGKIITP